MVGDPLSPAVEAITAHPAALAEDKPAAAEPAKLDDLSADELASPPPAEHVAAAPVLGDAGVPAQSAEAAEQSLALHTAAPDASTAGDGPGAPTADTAPPAAASPVPAAASNGSAGGTEPSGDQAGITARTPSVTESMAAALASKLRHVIYEILRVPLHCVCEGQLLQNAPPVLGTAKLGCWGSSVSTRREHRVRASPSLQLPSRVAAEIETPPQGSPDANASGGAGDLGSVPGSGDSFAHAVVKQAARLRSAMWRGGERVRTPDPLPQRGSSVAAPVTLQRTRAPAARRSRAPARFARRDAASSLPLHFVSQ